jgi:diacylglycerol kinase
LGTDVLETLFCARSYDETPDEVGMSLVSEPHESAASGETASSVPRPPRSWRRKFHDACRGLKCGIRGQSSFFVHFFFTALVIAAALALRCTPVEWCLLTGCIGFVLVAELFNSAVETLFRGLDEAGRDRAWPALDIAAGAVLLASGVAVVVGLIVFLGRLALLFSPAV